MPAGKMKPVKAAPVSRAKTATKDYTKLKGLRENQPGLDASDVGQLNTYIQRLKRVANPTTAQKAKLKEYTARKSAYRVRLGDTKVARAAGKPAIGTPGANKPFFGKHLEPYKKAK